ncbi:AMP-dependent synthetase/ligase [Nocardioides marinquilinus]|uniref:Acyl-CoA synthetase n=1 Tax=Nocardioides marinquilinus TaxID=1210400 RepID=A0ABP9PTK6_9ACTN
MREYSTPLTLDLPTAGNLTDAVVRNAERAPQRVAFSRRPPAAAPDADWDDVTAAAFLDEVRGVAKGLVALGVGAGDRVVLMSSTRYEWTLLDYAIWFAGAVTVPVYPSSPAATVELALGDSGARAALVETSDHLALVDGVRGGLDALAHVLALDEGAVDDLVRRGADVADDVLEQRRAAAGPDDPATVIYTSGTTGRPRGCVLTHGNLMTEVAVTLHELGTLFAPDAQESDDGDGGGADAGGATGGDDAAPATLLFLPLAHVLARVIQVGAVTAGVRLGHSAGAVTLAPTLRSFRPTFVLAVPRVFEKLFTTASQRATADGRGAVFDRAVTTAIAWSRALDRGRRSPVLRARHAVMERLVYRRLRDDLGGRCRFAVSGGAPLGDRLGHFYRGIGIPVLEGYGLTETTAAITTNTPEAHKVGTVGRPLPGAAVRVDDDGELLVRGGQVFAGYWDDDAATAEVLDADGWLHTGDVGEVDDEGFVRVTGRKKEILVTAGGKNVAPAVLEDGLRAHPLVSQALVVGDRQPFVAALVTLDAEALAQWAQGHGKRGGPAELARDDDLVAEVQQAVDAANAQVSKAESIRRFVVLDRDWTEEAGHLTPSLKLRRNVVVRAFRDEIADLYR